MYKKILVPLENSASDHAILEHIKPLAQMTGAGFLLIHVADGFGARNYNQLNLAESEEMKNDRIYLKTQSEALHKEGFEADHLLAMGEPADEIIKCAREHKVDLIAMATHGHRLIGDLIYGNTADKVRHLVDIPVLMLKAKP